MPVSRPALRRWGGGSALTRRGRGASGGTPDPLTRDHPARPGVKVEHPRPPARPGAVAAAVAELRHRGVTRVALVGASMGGAAVLIAGTRVQPPVAAVVSLSGEADPTSLVGGIPLNAGAAVKQLAVPTMFVVATNDRYVSVEETRAMYQAVNTGDKRLTVASGPFDGRHGWQLLNDPASGEFSSVAANVAAFLTAHTRG